MVSTVDAARSALNLRYAPMRKRILDHYATLALVGAEPRGKAATVPRKLGHWVRGPGGHSGRVLAACPELAPTVGVIERLLDQRDPDLITRAHTPLNPGHNFRRNPGKDRTRLQLNPGEWPPRYK
jgi:hypothetical protein